MHELLEKDNTQTCQVYVAILMLCAWVMPPVLSVDQVNLFILISVIK